MEIQDNKHYTITSSTSLAARTESPLANASMAYEQINFLILEVIWMTVERSVYGRL